MKAAIRYFRWPFAVTLIGLGTAYLLGLFYIGSNAGAVSFLVVTAALSVLEISLSFDNAIVNADKLQYMQPVWQRRFLTWGILIAVFGMRIIFPLFIVAVAANIGPLAAIHLAASDPILYAEIINDAHLPIAAFGGTFLLMVALNYFIDEGKEVDWIRILECQLRRCACIRGLEIALVLSVVMAFTFLLPDRERTLFLTSSIFGLLMFLAVEVLSHVLSDRGAANSLARAGGLGAFLYLEVLDASFSFDGVVGAFALTQNIFLIAIGLGIGAMYVRSMTVMFVEKRTLAQFRYLEHGAYYSIMFLALVMFVQTLTPIPEVFSGLFGACLIMLAQFSSLRYNKKMSKTAARERT